MAATVAGKKLKQTPTWIETGTEERAEAVSALIDSGSNIVLFIASTKKYEKLASLIIVF